MHANSPEYDVFLSYSHADKECVFAIAEQLRQRDLKVWIDDTELAAGDVIHNTIFEAFANVAATAVFIGTSGLGNYQAKEVNSAFTEFIDNKKPIFVVLLPGVLGLPASPAFLREFKYVQFVDNIAEPETLDRLANDIKAKIGHGVPRLEPSGPSPILRVDPETDWAETMPVWWLKWAAPLFRVRYIAITSACLLILGAGLIFCPRFEGAVGIGITVLVFLTVFVFPLMLAIRSMLITNLRVDDRLHALLHEIRNESAAILEKLPTQRKAQIEAFHESVVEHIARFFKERVGDPNVECCIRLAQSSTDGFSGRKLREDVVYYVTVARSRGVPHRLAREDGSEPIPSDKGLPYAFLRSNKEGAYLIRDLKKAEQQGIWWPLRNDQYAENDCYLVCPINKPVRSNNKPNGSSKDMIGLLYLISNKSRPLQPAHWSAQSAIADLLGHVYPLLFDGVRKAFRLKTPKPESSTFPDRI